MRTVPLRRPGRQVVLRQVPARHLDHVGDVVEHGLPVSARAMGMVQLVVSELVTNARKYAPGPCLLDLEINEGAVQITVWDSDTTLPSVQAADPTRIGQHGLEIVMALSQTFCVHREPVGKRITASLVLADDPGGDAAGHQAM
ncbi:MULTISPECIES: ATP-binding protein [Streptomyces rochei group]|uniref:ATP-binding protein n=1 Tax=Streptomyces rochei group TaxID=2867164 RepID=UPI0035AB909C